MTVSSKADTTSSLRYTLVVKGTCLHLDSTASSSFADNIRVSSGERDCTRASDMGGRQNYGRPWPSGAKSEPGSASIAARRSSGPNDGWGAELVECCKDAS